MSSTRVALNTGNASNSENHDESRMNYAAIGRQFVSCVEICLNEAPVSFSESGTEQVSLSEYRQQIVRELVEFYNSSPSSSINFASYQGTHIYGCWCANRTTPIVVRAVNATEARKLANSKKKSNAGEIIKVARLDERDAQKARQGEWVRTRVGGSKPESYAEGKSGKGAGKECGGSYISKGYECRVGQGKSSGNDDDSPAEPKQKGKLADSDREEIKQWLKAEEEKIQNPDTPYDDDGEQIGTTEEHYRKILDPDIVAKMDDLSKTEGYNWDDWGDISAAAQVVATERVERAMGVEKESWNYDDEIMQEMEAITGISFSEQPASTSRTIKISNLIPVSLIASIN